MARVGLSGSIDDEDPNQENPCLGPEEAGEGEGRHARLRPLAEPEVQHRGHEAPEIKNVRKRDLWT